MFRRRQRPRVVAELPAPRRAQGRAGSLSRSELRAFEDLRRAIGDARVVLTTGEESSRVALGLATVAGAGGRRAALLECDLVSPAFAATLGLAAAPGLREYLRGEAEARQILQPVALAGPGSAAAAPLVCVTAGARSADAAALLGSEHLRHAVAKLRNAYDLVVLDGPPPDEEQALKAAASQADATLACLPRSASAVGIPMPVSGLVLSG
jgi:Mrp family chromosome partitioning ATPase